MRRRPSSRLRRAEGATPQDEQVEEAAYLQMPDVFVAAGAPATA